MTATAAPTVKDQKLVPIGLVESASVNSINDFAPSKLNKREQTNVQPTEDYANTFICHLIFYAIFCVSLVLYILIDLGLGSFIKNKLSQFIGTEKNTVFRKSHAFA